MYDNGPVKAKAIGDMEPPAISCVRQFIPALVELLKPFHKLLNKNVSFKGNEEQQATFWKVIDLLSSHLTMMSHVKDLPVVNAEIYFRGGGGVMARALSTTEANEEMQHVHDL